MLTQEVNNEKFQAHDPCRRVSDQTYYGITEWWASVQQDAIVE